MGTLKRYKSKKGLSITARMSDGRGAYVRFGTAVDGSGLFVTTDSGLQSAVEQHPKFGSLFVTDGTESVDYDITEPKVTYSVTDYEDVIDRAAERCEALADAIVEADQAVSDINTAGENALEAIEAAIQGLDITYEVLT